MKRTTAAVAVVVPTAPAASSPREPDPAGAVEALRARLAGTTAREHVVLDFLEDDLREVRTALSAVAAYVANVEAALGEGEPSGERLLSLARVGPWERLDYLSTVLASVRRRLAQVAVRM
ncbi:MAG TPA: hypothetical protein VML50_12335 [Anaeromyxobacter sp.]|nr:hypothetical protein [Anaeromyxobacter sp.]